jgi:hypothetical protein
VTARQIYIKKDTCKVSHLCLAAAEVLEINGLNNRKNGSCRQKQDHHSLGIYFES